MSETLTENEAKSLEKIAELRGYAGQLRAALLDLRDQCAYDSVVSAIVDQALAIPAPENR